MTLPDIDIHGINIIEHADFAADEGWIVFDRNAPQVPQDLRDTLNLPCILTGNVERSKHMLTFLQAVGVLRPPDSYAQPN